MLTEKWTADVDVSVALGVGNEAYKMYTRAGWIDHGKMLGFARLIDARYIIQRRITISAVARVVCVIVNLCLKLRDDIRLSRSSRCDVKRVDRFDHAIDELWYRASVYYDVIAKRDSVYLNWKYANESGLPYSMFEFSWEDQVIGYSILITREENEIRTGYIVDFFAEPRHVKCIMRHTVKYFRRQRVQKVCLYILCKRLEAVLRKMGFHHRVAWARMMVKSKNDLCASVGDSDKWFVTLGDSDLTEEFLNDTRSRERN